MKNIFALIIFTLAVSGCTQKTADTTTPPATMVPSSGPDYFAEYGIPDQSLVNPCAGDKELVRPITKCTKRSTNTVVNIALCYSLAPVLMSIPSPAGQKQTSITGGTKLESCEEGSTTVTATAFSCNAGFVLSADKCQSYATVGSYAIQKDQSYHIQGGLKLIYTVGNDHGTQVKDGLTLNMTNE